MISLRPSRRSFLFESLESRHTPASLLPDFAESTVASGLSQATAMEFSPDGKLFIAEQGGTMEVWSGGARLQANFFRDTPLATQTVSERGLLGIAFDPDYADNRFVYVYYTTTASDNHNRVSRFTANSSGNLALAGSETVLLELDPHAAGNHNGGALHFGPDEKLYIAVGDNANQNNGTGTHNSQRLTTLHGKMLRINADGTIPSDNPFLSQTTGKYRSIWALGLRNPFTFSFDVGPGGDGSGGMFINDVGQNAWEEIDVGAAAANYGWPATEGDFNQGSHPQFTRPFYSYNHDENITTPSGCAITGGVFYSPSTNTFGADYSGDYFFADFCGAWIYRIDAADKTVTRFAENIPAPVDLKIDDAGNLYYLSRGDGVVRRIANAGETSPEIGDHPVNQTVSEGQRATFTVSASGGQLRYQWQRADSATPNSFANIAGATSATYSIASSQLSDDSDRFRVVVSNSLGQATSNAATLTVLANRLPNPVITAPRSRATWGGGQEIQLAGMATDPEDGSLPASALSWEVRFYHNDGAVHFHPVDTFEGVSSASFVIPDAGHESVNVWFRILLTATDSDGAARTVKRDIHPRTVTISLASNPSGAPLLLDGAPAQSSFESVVGMRRTIEAPLEFQSAGTTYEFVSWSDGLAAQHEIVAPAADAVLTAAYGRTPPKGLRAEYFDLAAPLTGLPNLAGRTADVTRTEVRVLNRATTSPWPGLDNRFADTFASRHTGFLKVETAGSYRLYLTSDEGSRLWIDGQLVVDNDGVHRMRERSAVIDLAAGYHELRIEYFENTGQAGLVLAWEGPGIARQTVPAPNLFRSRPIV